MADIFYNASGDFSSAVPLKVVAANLAANYSNSFTTLNSERFIAFTASEAGDMLGVFIPIYVSVVTGTVTVKLQVNTGSWGDVAGATVTLTPSDIGRTALTQGVGYGAYNWVLCLFGTPAAIDTTASKWRVSILSSQAGYSICNSTTAGVYAHAVIINTTTSYSSGDNILVRDGITMVVDQSVTATTLITGTKARIEWENPPAAAYALTATDWFHSYQDELVIGSALSPIPAAERASLVLARDNNGIAYANGLMQVVEIYGNKPTNIVTTLAADAAASQKVIVTTSDMSADWQIGDVLCVTGAGSNTSVGAELGTIDTIVGTTITLVSNLGHAHYSGYSVWNSSKRSQCGVLYNVLNGGVRNPQPKRFYFSGVEMASTHNTMLQFSAQYGSYNILEELEPYKIDTVMAVAPTNIHGYTGNISQLDGGEYKNIFMYSSSYWTVGLYNQSIINNATWQDIYISRGGGGENNPRFAGGSNNTFERIESCGGGNTQSMWFVTNGSTLSDIRVMGARDGIRIDGNANRYSNIMVNRCTVVALTLGNGVENLITGKIGNHVACVANVGFQVSAYAQAILNGVTLNPADVDVSTTYPESNSINGSFVKFHKYGNADNLHKVYFVYGKTQSTGTGLTDTTVHTAGGFAIRFEPTSSVNNLEWEFTIPTGNIQNKTMMIGVWCKIGAVAYYAGTHQLPRLTIDYDDGTVAYVQAAETTDWQFLPLPFTPATTYGQITVTVSARTDATGSDAYVYWDDWVTIYPADAPLNTQTLDLWADALPVTPPIATVLSANDVWAAIASGMGAGTMGKLVTDYLNAAVGSIPTNPLLASDVRLDNLDGAISDLPTSEDIADAVLDEPVDGHTGWLTKLLSVVKFLGLK